jgi:hypothetical protein
MSDDDVEAALRAVLAAVDRVPESALAAANAAFGWRDLDADLALLSSESGLEFAHLRGAQPRLLTFRSGQTVIELEVSSVAGVARLLGQLDPPGAAEVTIESAAQPLSTRADGRGRFSVVGLTDSWMRVIVTRADHADHEQARTATEWFRA